MGFFLVAVVGEDNHLRQLLVGEFDGISLLIVLGVDFGNSLQSYEIGLEVRVIAKKNLLH